MSGAIKVTGSPTVYKADLRGQSRREAVECALELMHAHASSGCTKGCFDEHMNSLSQYADQIEAALIKK